jgi:PTS system nitrogen regulatory IIA component
VPVSKHPKKSTLSQGLPSHHILVVDEEIGKEEILKRLVTLLANKHQIDAELALKALGEREAAGSTFLNESVAIPHVRLPGLNKVHVALAITKRGIIDVETDVPIEAVFLLVAPEGGGAKDFKMLTIAVKVFQNLHIRRKVLEMQTAAEVWRVIADSEAN